MRVLGIDPGTSRWAFVFMENGELVDEISLQTEEVRLNPSKVLGLANDAELIVAPSGYGCPLKKVDELDEDDFSEILLKREGENRIMGLETVLRAFKESRLNAYVLPGVKLLPTVPKEKKKNKIDMGSPDKLCVAVAGIVGQARRLELRHNETNFILAEIGYGFDAFLKVKGGQVVDGIGGSLASSTWKGIDGEILYLQGKLRKEDLKKGDIPAKKVLAGAKKDIFILSKKSGQYEILVSGSQKEIVFDDLKKDFPSARRLELCKSSNAAFGAAVIADGLVGGKFKELVNLLQIKKARGSNLDFVYRA